MWGMLNSTCSILSLLELRFKWPSLTIARLLYKIDTKKCCMSCTDSSHPDSGDSARFLLAIWLHTQYLCAFSSCTVTVVRLIGLNFICLVWIRILHGNAFVVPFPCFFSCFHPTGIAPVPVTFSLVSFAIPSRSDRLFFWYISKHKVCTTTRCKKICFPTPVVLLHLLLLLPLLLQYSHSILPFPLPCKTLVWIFPDDLLESVCRLLVQDFFCVDHCSNWPDSVRAQKWIVYSWMLTVCCYFVAGVNSDCFTHVVVDVGMFAHRSSTATDCTCFLHVQFTFFQVVKVWSLIRNFISFSLFYCFMCIPL